MSFRRKTLKYEQPNHLKKRYYSFLTIVLLICCLIVGYSVLLNISKIIAYQGKLIEMKKIQLETAEKNESLKKQLQDLDSRSYEAIARNNLKMAGENEVLVIIKQDKPQETKKQKKKKKKNKEKKEEPKKD